MHRFHVTRDEESADDQDSGVTICYSSVCCNPTINKSLGPKFMFKLYTFYALCLFRDGVAEVLRP